MSAEAHYFLSIVSSHDDPLKKIRTFFASKSNIHKLPLILRRAAESLVYVKVFQHLLHVYFVHNIPVLAIQFEMGNTIMQMATPDDVRKIPEDIMLSIEIHLKHYEREPNLQYNGSLYRFYRLLTKMLQFRNQQGDSQSTQN